MAPRARAWAASSSSSIAAASPRLSPARVWQNGRQGLAVERLQGVESRQSEGAEASLPPASHAPPGLLRSAQRRRRGHRTRAQATLRPRQGPRGQGRRTHSATCDTGYVEVGPGRRAGSTSPAHAWTGRRCRRGRPPWSTPRRRTFSPRSSRGTRLPRGQQSQPVRARGRKRAGGSMPRGTSRPTIGTVSEWIVGARERPGAVLAFGQFFEELLSALAVGADRFDAGHRNWGVSRHDAGFSLKVEVGSACTAGFGSTAVGQKSEFSHWSGQRAGAPQAGDRLREGVRTASSRGATGPRAGAATTIR
jgi:hypothetical protein